ncbi:ribosome-associated translation inhibitor RaiA [Candidatus Peregrinibacteria bacterium]|nr:ribosome-associated translation inhibitor RaiA [Candidatus Peregrinibacteria bacterium]
MNIQFVKSHFNLTDEQKDYITKKLEHLEKFAERLKDESVEVHVSVKENKLKTTDNNVSIEITMIVPHAVIRAEINGKTIEEAVDLCEEKLRGQIERYKGKLHRRTDSGQLMPASTLEQIAGTQEEFKEMKKILKRKTFKDIKQMHEEEAIEQMELLAHDFFVFENSATGMPAIVYRRKDNTYGIIDINK